MGCSCSLDEDEHRQRHADDAVKKNNARGLDVEIEDPRADAAPVEEDEPHRPAPDVTPAKEKALDDAGKEEHHADDAMHPHTPQGKRDHFSTPPPPRRMGGVEPAAILNPATPPSATALPFARQRLMAPSSQRSTSSSGTRGTLSSHDDGECSTPDDRQLRSFTVGSPQSTLIDTSVVSPMAPQAEINTVSSIDDGALSGGQGSKLSTDSGVAGSGAGDVSPNISFTSERHSTRLRPPVGSISGDTTSDVNNDAAEGKENVRDAQSGAAVQLQPRTPERSLHSESGSGNSVAVRRRVSSNLVIGPGLDEELSNTRSASGTLTMSLGRSTLGCDADDPPEPSSDTNTQLQGEEQETSLSALITPPTLLPSNPLQNSDAPDAGGQPPRPKGAVLPLSFAPLTQVDTNAVYDDLSPVRSGSAATMAPTPSAQATPHYDNSNNNPFQLPSPMRARQGNQRRTLIPEPVIRQEDPAPVQIEVHGTAPRGSPTEENNQIQFANELRSRVKPFMSATQSKEASPDISVAYPAPSELLPRSPGPGHAQVVGGSAGRGRRRSTSDDSRHSSASRRRGLSSSHLHGDSFVASSDQFPHGLDSLSVAGTHTPGSVSLVPINSQHPDASADRSTLSSLLDV